MEAKATETKFKLWREEDLTALSVMFLIPSVILIIKDAGLGSVLFIIIPSFFSRIAFSSNLAKGKSKNNTWELIKGIFWATLICFFGFMILYAAFHAFDRYLETSNDGIVLPPSSRSVYAFTLVTLIWMSTWHLTKIIGKKTLELITQKGWIALSPVKSNID